MKNLKKSNLLLGAMLAGAISSHNDLGSIDFTDFTPCPKNTFKKRTLTKKQKKARACNKRAKKHRHK